MRLTSNELKTIWSRQMKLEKFKKSIVNNMPKIAGGMLLGGLTMMYGAHSDRERLTQDVKKQVIATGISKEDFKKLDDSISLWNSRDKAISWQHALDSIKNKGAVEKAYFEGAQMVRDSLKAIR